MASRIIRPELKTRLEFEASAFETSSSLQVQRSSSLVSRLVYYICQLHNSSRTENEAAKMFEAVLPLLKRKFKIDSKFYQIDFTRDGELLHQIFSLNLQTEQNTSSLILERNRCRMLSDGNSSRQFSIRQDSVNEDFENLVKIGKGGFGSVVRARCKMDGKDYAIKQIPVKSEALEGSLSEVQILSDLVHTNIVRYHTSWFDKDCLFESDGEGSSSRSSDATMYTDDSSSIQFKDSVTKQTKISKNNGVKKCKADNNAEKSEQQWPLVPSRHIVPELPTRVFLTIQMELCRGTLREWLDERNDPENVEVNYSDEENTKILKQVFKGVDYIHANVVIHRDLKPSNIFFNNHGDVKIGDFGLACQWPSAQVREKRTTARSMTTEVGTHHYMSPEMRRNSKDYDHKTDIYSLGIIVYEMICPFRTKMEANDRLEKLRTSIKDPEVENKFEMPWIKKMISKNPKNRPEASAILNSEMFVSKSDIIREQEEMIKELKKELRHKKFIIKQLNKTISVKNKAIEKYQTVFQFMNLVED